MFIKHFIIPLITIFYISCSDEPTSSKETLTVTVTDIDGNTYEIVKIGNQWWMAENLKVTNYRNGEAIPNVTEDSAWSNLSTGAWCSYNNDVSNIETYGRLYNWYAVNDSLGLAPEGWHVASEEDWQELVDFLGGFLVAGGKMKTTGTIEEGDGLWYLYANDSTDATNESGFSGIPGGHRHHYGESTSIGRYANFWSSTENINGGPECLRLAYHNSYAWSQRADSRYGFSVRCVKD